MRSGLALGVAVALIGLAGCANWGPVQVGESRDAVLARLGPPTATVRLTLHDVPAVERLQYSGQPQGQFANMVDLDAQGRVVRSFQALTAARFQAITAQLQQSRLTRDDVLREFGRPAQTTAVTSWQGPIWLYRYVDSADMRYAFYFDPEGVLRRGHPEMEERRRRFPNL
jgi:hypothetical protein